MKHKDWFAAALAACVLSGGASAWADEVDGFTTAAGTVRPGQARGPNDPCSAAPAGPPNVTSELSIVPTQLRRSRSYVELTRVKGGEDSRVMGLTSDSFGYRVEFAEGISISPSGSACAWIARAKVIWTISSRFIDVSSEVPEGSCLDQEILTHERRHEAVDSEQAAKWRGPAEEAARAAAGRIGPVRFFSTGVSGEARTHLKTQEESLGKAVAQVGARMNRETSERQAQIDTPEEYARLGRACGGAAPALLRRFGN